MFVDLVDLWERAALDGTPVEDITGEDPVEFAAGPARLRLSCRQEGERVLFSSEFSLERSVLSPADYEQLRELLDRWVRSQRSLIILERQPGGGS